MVDKLVEFDLLGQQVRFIGDVQDEYFFNIAAHAAQNEMLFGLMKIIFKDGGGIFGCRSKYRCYFKGGKNH